MGEGPEEGGEEEKLHEDLEEVNKELEEVKEALVTSTNRLQEVWKVNCAQLREFDAIIQSKDEEIALLKTQLSELRDSGTRSGVSNNGGGVPPSSMTTYPPSKQSGKAPPIDSFSGELEEILFDDWLPSLNRTSEWNGWKEEEKLLQLAGHLRGKALEEWNLIEEKERSAYTSAVSALRIRLDGGGGSAGRPGFSSFDSGRERVSC